MSFKALSELLEVPLRNGLTKPKKVRGSGIKMVNMGELFKYPRIKNVPMDRAPLTDKELFLSLLKAGDLLFARQSLVREGAGKCSIFLGDNEPAFFESHLIRCRLDAKNFNPLFYYYYFDSPLGKQSIDAIIEQGAGASGIRGSDLTNLQVPVPPIEFQDNVAAILDTIDRKIETNHQINQTLEQMAQALFKSWFVDFEPVKAKIAALEAGGSEEDALLAAMQAISGSALFDADASAASAEERLSRLQAEQPEQYPELRATAELFPSAMQDSELGEIPEGWDVQQIGEILDRLKPKKRYTKKQVVPTGQTPVFEQGSDILLGFHNDSPGFIATSEDPAFIFGDHTCIIHLSCQNFDVSQNVIPLKGKSRSTMWTYYALQGKQTFQEYRRHWAELVVKPVIYPPNALCKQFSETINSSIRLKEQLDQEAKRLSEIRDLLLPKLLSGQLSVSGTANCVPEVEEVTDV
jgi:type I restriction enzyme S subunit